MKLLWAPPRPLTCGPDVLPPPEELLQTTVFVDPAAPGGFQTTVCVNLAAHEVLQKTNFVDPTAPGSLQNVILSIQRIMEASRLSFLSIQRLWQTPGRNL